MTARVLVVGGYGGVGGEMVRLLAGQTGIRVVVGGRDETKARAAAAACGGEAQVVDAGDRTSLERALTGVDLVVNCFAGPFTGAPPVLPEVAISRGVHALDVSGSWSYCEAVLELGARAAERGVTLVTALGANPCLPGLLFLAACQGLDEVESGELLFAMTEGMANVLSAAGFAELHHMMAVPPRVFEGGNWVEAPASSLRRRLGPPVDRPVYFGPLLTRDMLCLPALTGARRFSAWNGATNLLEGTVFMLGMWLGAGRSARGAERLRWWLARCVSRAARPQVVVEAVAVGRQGDRAVERTLAAHGDEVRVTALVPAAVALEIAHGGIVRRGAFVAPEVVEIEPLLRRLTALGLPVEVRERPLPASR